jgi:pimeloyl-ACP methyl ester carboxylesterase
VPLLCLPGLTRDARDFDDLGAALGGRYRLVRLTLRGRGASDRDPDWRNYVVPVEARDVRRLPRRSSASSGWWSSAPRAAG